MTLSDYLDAVPSCGAAAALAERIGVSAVVISQWRNGVRRVPTAHCISIEKATGGEVRCEDLRPDVDWAFLRGSRLDDFQRIADSA